MSLLELFGIGTAYAATPAAGQHQNLGSALVSMLPMMLIFVLVFYFLFIRPQTKRNKEHKSMLDDLAVGDEISTTGGIVGRLAKIRDNYIVINVNKDTEIVMQKNAIASVLPKGTLESMD